MYTWQAAQDQLFLGITVVSNEGHARPDFRTGFGFEQVIVQVLEGDNAVAKHREIMGATDPKKAAPGTIRADLAASIEENVVHGSDSLDNSAREIGYFFAETELCPRTR